MTVLPEIAFVVTPKNVFVPDVSIIATERLVRIGQKYIPRAPELAVEVVSPSEGAVYLKMKTDAYLANGSRSVWIVFPETRSVMIYTSESVREVKGHQLIEDPLLPGFSCPVSAFFELT